MKRACLIVGVSALVATLAFCDDPTTDVVDQVLLPELIVSDGFAVSTVAPGSDPIFMEPGGQTAAYVSLPPGTLPEMVSVRIRNVATGWWSSAIPIVEGGFDPVTVAGDVGDELELTFTRAGGSVTVVYARVPKRRPPRVVRTNPPRGRTDVALSIHPVVVFSEPIDPETLAAGVRLMKDGTELAIGVAPLPGQLWIAEIVPAEPLAHLTTYTLQVGSDIRDLDGDALEEPVTVTFTTGEPANPSVAATLEIVSGDDQPGKAGTELPEPFVVRLTDETGAGIPGQVVEWTIASGEGVLDGLWTRCGGSDELSHPEPSTSVRTDADGLARISFMPTWFGQVTVTAEASAYGAVVTFGTDASDPGATLEVVTGYGDLQETWAWAYNGWWMHPPLVVTVKDGQGNPVPDIDVKWRVDSGEGLVSGCFWWTHLPWSMPEMSVRTGDRALDRQGVPLPSVSATWFTPTALGISTVTASVPGVAGSPVTFRPQATVAVIHLFDQTAGEPAQFFGPDRSATSPSDVVVPVGTKTEFDVWPEVAHIVSTSVPAGGISFDSGLLKRNDWAFDPENDPWFGFVPNVAGTWTFVDQISGVTGTLTAEEAPQWRHVDAAARRPPERVDPVGTPGQD